ncbi:uracil-DNA glycosylase [Aurantibacillus circumpalustris]|uniref:uracil-DNA glycosylase n=1 Tax=Aurantibacillus circumpalustris TaxID=3036359 RepID=UPI00295C0C97|nr:uracil-DNA glycosylase [Aurantibacillus circumpalustris]
MVNKSINASWNKLLSDEFEKPYYYKLSELVNNAYEKSVVYPPSELVFNALIKCPLDKIKVVLIGQDPYHRIGQAHGLSFSVSDGIKKPQSLQNIFKELLNDVPEFKIPKSGNLEKWANQGVLLLNTILTVQEGLPGSHKSFGWEVFTDAVIKLISENKTNIVFMLWGNYARSKADLIDENKHLILKAAHPSPLARGAFFGSRHFSKTNAFLTEKGINAINWNLE